MHGALLKFFAELTSAWRIIKVSDRA